MIEQMDGPQNKKDLNWMRFNSVFLIEVLRDSKVYTSTAVAIDKRTLITAAHSVDAADTVTLCMGHEYANDCKKIEANYWVINPNYNPSKSLYENDVAVIHLKEDLPVFTHYENLGEDTPITKDSILERVGFGGREGRNIKTWTNPSYTSITFNSKNYILKDKLSVVGDSGGPIYAATKNGHKLVGLHSTLEGSDKTYIVNLSQYRDWIYNLEVQDVIN